MENVQNALSPEEKPIIENIISLFQQLLSMQEAQAAPAVEEAIDNMDSGEEDQEEIKKAVTDETGDSTAEERIANVTPTTDDSLQDLNKSIKNLTNILTGKNVVKKSTNIQPVKKDNQSLVLKQVADLLKTIVQKQDNQEKLNAQLFDALGFTDEVVKKSITNEESKAKSKPIQTLDTTAVVKDVLTEVFKNIPALNQNPEYRHPFNQKIEVRKNMRDIAAFIHNKGK